MQGLLISVWTWSPMWWLQGWGLSIEQHFLILFWNTQILYKRPEMGQNISVLVSSTRARGQVIRELRICHPQLKPCSGQVSYLPSVAPDTSPRWFILPVLQNYSPSGAFTPPCPSAQAIEGAYTHRCLTFLMIKNRRDECHLKRLQKTEMLYKYKIIDHSFLCPTSHWLLASFLLTNVIAFNPSPC